MKRGRTPRSGFPFSFLRGNAVGAGGAGGDEIEVILDAATVHDIWDLFNTCPVIRVACKTLLAMVMPGPFTFSIPKLGVESSEEMERIIEAYWMKWIRAIWFGCVMWGVCPWFLVWRGNHQVPEVPDFTLGNIAVVTNVKTRQRRFKWYDSYADATIGQGPMAEAAKDMYWVVTEDAPASDGTIRSACACLLSQWRSLQILQKARDVVATQRARPTHLLIARPDPKKGQDNNLMFMSAEYGAAAGIGQQRLEENRQAQLRQNAARLKQALRDTQARNMAASSVKPTLWTDTPQSMLDEMDNGFGNRSVPINEGWDYREAAKPDMVADVEKVAHEFNILAAAVMDSNVEFFTPTGGVQARAHQGAMIDRFTNGRLREKSQFFKSIIQAALVVAYRPQFREVMDKANAWRASRFKGMDVTELGVLHPELDVQVNMPKSTITSWEELTAMRDAGIITQKTMTEYQAQAKNMPTEDFVTMAWPDNIPQERLVKPQQQQQQVKPPKKKVASV